MCWWHIEMHCPSWMIPIVAHTGLLCDVYILCSSASCEKLNMKLYIGLNLHVSIWSFEPYCDILYRFIILSKHISLQRDWATVKTRYPRSCCSRPICFPDKGTGLSWINILCLTHSLGESNWVNQLLIKSILFVNNSEFSWIQICLLVLPINL